MNAAPPRTSPSLWYGVAIVLAGSLVIQLGQPTHTP
jgi:hypothetical protein